MVSNHYISRTTHTYAHRPWHGKKDAGGGVQNGRFSHRGEEIAIVNANNWVDGGVASPTPFFCSTTGYGLMWHTFASGRYDFGKAKEDETVTLTIQGKDLKGINGISLCIPYDPTTLEYTGNTAATPAKEMYNMTRDRLHTNGQKALYPTLVNIGNGNVLDGDCELMQLTFKAVRDADIKVNATDGILVDKRNRAVTF